MGIMTNFNFFLEKEKTLSSIDLKLHTIFIIIIWYWYINFINKTAGTINKSLKQNIILSDLNLFFLIPICF